MAEISGVEGSVLAGGAELEASEWSIDMDTAVIDRTSFVTGGEPLNARGQHTGSITMTGPVSTTTLLIAKGINRGLLVNFTLRVTPNLTLALKGRVSKFAITQNKDNGSNWTINAAQYGAPTVIGI